MIDMLDEAVLAGHPRAVARAITLAENGGHAAAELVEKLRPLARTGHLVGITGAPGAGKSTLICQLAKELRARGRSVGVIAVDPSSPFTGGAVLGDRIRMQELACDSEVFVRSMASRGRLGGLAAAVEDAAIILRAAGKDVVLVETVGVGQGELDVAGIAHTVVLVLTPGMGDEVQSLKAGVMEVGDIFVVNKADLEGADAVARSLQAHVDHPAGGWTRPIILTSSVAEQGIGELADAIDRHRSFLDGRAETTEAEIRLRSRAILSLAARRVMDEMERSTDPETLRDLARAVAAGDLEPGQAAREVYREFLGDCHGEATSDSYERSGRWAS